MRIPIILALALCILFGCVSQDKYDSLTKNCDQEKLVLSENIALEKATCAESKDAITKCSSEKNALQTLLNRKNAEIAAMRTDAGKIAQARVKTGQIAKYGLTLKYFDDAFGPDKIPNSAKLQKIDEMVESLSDPQVLAAWQSVKNCGSSNECDASRQNFVGMIDARVGALAREAAEIIK